MFLRRHVLWEKKKVAQNLVRLVGGGALNIRCILGVGIWYGSEFCRFHIFFSLSGFFFLHFPLTWVIFLLHMYLQVFFAWWHSRKMDGSAVYLEYTASQRRGSTGSGISINTVVVARGVSVVSRWCCQTSRCVVPKRNSPLFTTFNSRIIEYKEKYNVCTNNAQYNSTASSHCTVTNHPILPCSEKGHRK